MIYEIIALTAYLDFCEFYILLSVVSIQGQLACLGLPICHRRNPLSCPIGQKLCASMHDLCA